MIPNMSDCELLLVKIRELLCLSLSLRIESYRGGYSVSDRLLIESRLRSGDINCSYFFPKRSRHRSYKCIRTRHKHRKSQFVYSLWDAVEWRSWVYSTEWKSRPSITRLCKYTNFRTNECG